VADPRAGTLADASELIDVDALLAAYHDLVPDPTEPSQRVAFGTSGHRGSSLSTSFNEAHILATTQAICDHRAATGIDGPLFLGADTHALSGPALRTALGVLVANGVEVVVDRAHRPVPTPAISHAILAWNAGRASGLADGIVVTPSHNPPADGGFKYNPPHGGPADSNITSAIEAAANRLLADLGPVRREDGATARERSGRYDFVSRYVEDLPNVVDVALIRSAGVRIGVNPLAGAAVDYWAAIAEQHHLDLEVVDASTDPTFRTVPRDHDGKIRMDCSSPYAMSALVAMADRFDVAVGNDADADRHGIVTPSAGLLNPNRYLAVCIEYLFGGGRPGWPGTTAIGKTLVSSSLIDRVAADLDRRLVEVPVGFKWFVDGLRSGTLGFGGEESAGASFLRFDGTTWTTDKDGLIAGLLAAEMTARGADPGERAAALNERLGAPVYRRVDAPASAAEKAILGRLTPQAVTADSLAGEAITAVLTEAPGNGAAIGGLKVVTGEGWFAARPSGTEDLYKIYAESFRGEEHLERILAEARDLVGAALAGGSAS
jgi:phosphoglucomutase